MGQLWNLYEEYLERQDWTPSQRQVALKIEMSPTAFGNWRASLTDLPQAENLVRFADLIRIPYATVLDAALHDAGYLPRPDVTPQARQADIGFGDVHITSEQAAARHGASQGRRRASEQDHDAERPDAPAGVEPA